MSAPTALPRLVITAPASGHGKTTVATGLMGALRGEGLEVAGFKVGPDYIDPGYHALATGRPGRNLDPHLCHPEQLAPLLLHGARTPVPADVAVVEGVMGLFDGRMGGDGFASTAHVAGLVDAPLVVVVDISRMARTTAALVHGLHTFDPDVRLSGVILNKAGSPRLVDEITAALEATGLPVLGVLPRDAGIEAPSRHLGLVPAAERDQAAGTVRRLAEQVAEHVDLRAVLALAHAAPPLTAEPWNPADHVSPPSPNRPRVAVAAGRAFTFRYAETDELLRAAGCEPVELDPLVDTALPEGTSGLYLGGGFPEVHAAELSANTALRTALADAIAAGLPAVAECAGLLYLCRSVDGVPMVGALDAEAVMTPKLTLRYQGLVAPTDGLLGPAGTRATGHEFHRTVVTPMSGDTAAWLVGGEADGFSADPAGLGHPTLHASYQHVHWAGHPRLAQAFADAVHDRAARTAAPDRPQAEQGPGAYDLDHHGDSDATEGLVDLAVNVARPAPPDWLRDVINASTATLGAYPRTDEAAKAIAAAHDVDVDHVLPTAGGAEAFTLVARAFTPRHALVVHPQFTEPEAALLAAGHRPARLVLDAADGFVLDPAAVPDAADLVVVGNPTNPTSVLHPRATLEALVRPGRVLVVDEAFMDAVPGEPASLAGADLPGVLVLRSLTKTWGLAGLRAGYVVGDPALVDRLRAQQPPWSVSTPALAATVACLTPAARAEAAAAAERFAGRRQALADALAPTGLVPAGDPRAPFVLLDTSALRPDRPAGWLRLALRDQGFAARRGETFPGLDASWIRVAVRDETTSAALAAAVVRCLG
ncbi:cobyrinate a,c-diamide synthase [Microlunatus flavus]|uniref:Hydrogenobyrinate a,c-diamide synthase n=1 Tax=Microlunatus flavus TaxID=1036181 RepID=A0A1H9NPV2_9ACTN|nr:cobyrinate a,c-diamide synthase [Microlunatus flavus]SER37767.1 cobyrinic acid a,c-diamide synthase [Microlunatus flavus]